MYGLQPIVVYYWIRLLRLNGSPVLPTALFLQVFQGDLPPVTVLWMVAIDAVQFQISGHCSELHIDPTMCVAFPKIITDRWLVDELEMVPLIMLPLVGMTIEISFGMLAFGEHFQ